MRYKGNYEDMHYFRNDKLLDNTKFNIFNNNFVIMRKNQTIFDYMYMKCYKDFFILIYKENDNKANKIENTIIDEDYKIKDFMVFSKFAKENSYFYSIVSTFHKLKLISYEHNLNLIEYRNNVKNSIAKVHVSII